MNSCVQHHSEMNNQVGGLRNCVFVLTAVILTACAAINPVKSGTSVESKPAIKSTDLVPEGYFLPKNVFKGASQGGGEAVAGASPPFNLTGKAAAIDPMVWLYESPTSQTYFRASGIDFKLSVRMWEIFLRKYSVPHKVVSSPDQLGSVGSGVLVLPSLVALSDTEKSLIANFRRRGGSVLSTWLTGVRDDRGVWQGFSFMRDVLGAVVIGDTEGEEDENFMMTHGDGAITHSLPAGQRIWMERVKGVYPLRLTGQQSAAQIQDWSRTIGQGKPATTIVFGEHPQSSGVLSRTVVLGYPERLWMSTDPKAMDSIAHNALTWLFRQPDTYLSAWPFPFTNALTIAVDASEVVNDVDVKFSEWIEKTGARATFYVISGGAAKSATALKKLQAKGHEIGYMGDRYEGFQDQLGSTQTKRLTAMQQELRDAGLNIGPDLGFHAPMDSQDSLTLKLVNKLGFSHAVTFMDATEGRLPFTTKRVNDATGSTRPMVLLPRTQSGPEDLVGEGDPEVGLKQYLAEFDSAVAMGGMLLIRFPNQTVLTEEQTKAIFEQIGQHSEHMWQASNGAVARWWLERDRISVDTDSVGGKTSLSVTVSGEAPLTLSPSVIVNLPYPNATLRLSAEEQTASAVTTRALDPWRTAISLGPLRPGTYRWLLQFAQGQ